jgi:hypothetical protein
VRQAGPDPEPARGSGSTKRIQSRIQSRRVEPDPEPDPRRAAPEPARSARRAMSTDGGGPRTLKVQGEVRQENEEWEALPKNAPPGSKPVKYTLRACEGCFDLFATRRGQGTKRACGKDACRASLKGKPRTIAPQAQHRRGEARHAAAVFGSVLPRQEELEGFFGSPVQSQPSVAGGSGALPPVIVIIK